MNLLPASRKRRLVFLALLIALFFAAWQVVAHYHHKSYLNVLLGCQPVEGVLESGFHFQEYADSEPFRWTNGSAKLLVPINPKQPPQRLWVRIETFRPKATPIRFQILAGEIPIFDGVVPVGKKWERDLELPSQEWQDLLLIELRSDVFVPKGNMDGGKNTDTRVLGVQVKGLMLQRDNH